MVTTRILIAKDGRQYYQRDGKEVSTHLGKVSAEALAGVKDGEKVKSNVNEVFTVISPDWLDHYKQIKRGPQIMSMKDLGVISAETGIGPDTIVGDAGTGSGAGTCYFARIAKKVYSYDVVPEHVEIGKKNAEALGITNAEFAVCDIYEKVPEPQEGKYDVFVLDNPEPWKFLAHIEKIRIGGWIVAYMPSINQTAEYANAV